MREDSLLSAFKALNYNMRQMARRFLKEDDDVSDILQDAFCRLWSRRDSISDDEQAKAFTVVTVKNLCIDHMRKRKNTVGVDDREALHIMTDNIYDEQYRHELFRRVERIVDERLTDTQRKVYTLKEIDGLDTAEVAQKLGISAEAVRMNLSRARKAIRQCFKERN